MAELITAELFAPPITYQEKQKMRIFAAQIYLNAASQGKKMILHCSYSNWWPIPNIRISALR
jgi:hypothetical protein